MLQDTSHQIQTQGALAWHHIEVRDAVSLENHVPLLTLQAMHRLGHIFIDGLTRNPTHGLVAEIGKGIEAKATDFSEDRGALSYQWYGIASGELSEERSPYLVPTRNLDGDTVYCVISTKDGKSFETQNCVVRAAPPRILEHPDEQFWDQDDRGERLDLRAYVTGDDLRWAVTGQGCAIDDDGVLTIKTDSAATGALAQVTAENSGGRVVLGIPFHIEGDDVGPGPYLSRPVRDEVLDLLSLSIDDAHTLFWRRDPVGTNPDPQEVANGGGHASGSLPITKGHTSLNIDFGPGNGGLQQVSFVAEDADGDLSLVQSIVLEIDVGDDPVA